MAEWMFFRLFKFFAAETYQMNNIHWIYAKILSMKYITNVLRILQIFRNFLQNLTNILTIFGFDKFHLFSPICRKSHTVSWKMNWNCNIWHHHYFIYLPFFRLILTPIQMVYTLIINVIQIRIRIQRYLWNYTQKYRN